MNALLGIVGRILDGYKHEILKALLTWGVQLIGKSLLPWLGSLMGGPFGFLVSWGISYFTSLLYDMVERLARFGEIDKKWKEEADNMIAAQKKLQEAYEKKELDDQAVQDFLDAADKLSKYKLQ